VQVRGELTGDVRKKVNTLVITDVHARDIIDTFVRDSIMDAREFAWESQLRFYWDKDKVRLGLGLGLGLELGPGLGLGLGHFAQSCILVQPGQLALLANVQASACLMLRKMFMLHTVAQCSWLGYNRWLALPLLWMMDRY
jgi:hypothetical protein